MPDAGDFKREGRWLVEGRGGCWSEDEAVYISGGHTRYVASGLIVT